MQAASAIAAKYAHLSPVAPPAPPTTSSVAPVPPPAQTTPLPEEEGGTFAEKSELEPPLPFIAHVSCPN
jgi:hypothetical protein